ncbi:MAG: MoaD/ThiS family protein [Anaerolineae bacterium]|nr:MoaD/ThiS family protein [Anaerolineae bacterium]
MDFANLQIQVRYYGALAYYAGARQISVEVPAGSSLRDLLSRLEEINPPAYRRLLQGNTGGEPFLRVMLNDVLINQDHLNIPLNEGDRVTLVPGISGGSFENRGGRL